MSNLNPSWPLYTDFFSYIKESNRSFKLVLMLIEINIDIYIYIDEATVFRVPLSKKLICPYLKENYLDKTKTPMVMCDPSS